MSNHPLRDEVGQDDDWKTNLATNDVKSEKWGTEEPQVFVEVSYSLSVSYERPQHRDLPIRPDGP